MILGKHSGSARGCDSLAVRLHSGGSCPPSPPLTPQEAHSVRVLFGGSSAQCHGRLITDFSSDVGSASCATVTHSRIPE